AAPARLPDRSGVGLVRGRPWQVRLRLRRPRPARGPVEPQVPDPPGSDGYPPVPVAIPAQPHRPQRATRGVLPRRRPPHLTARTPRPPHPVAACLDRRTLLPHPLLLHHPPALRFRAPLLPAVWGCGLSGRVEVRDGAAH